MKKPLLTFIISFAAFTAFSQCNISIISIGQPTCLCTGMLTAVGSGVPPFHFQWSTGDTTSTIANLCPGIYTVTMNDGSGCTTIATAVISMPQPVVTSLTYTPASCGTCCDAQLYASVSGGCPPYTYQWTPPNPPVCPGTVYTLQVNDACGCVAIDSITPDTVLLATPQLLIPGKLTYQIIDNTIEFSAPVNEVTVYGVAGNIIFNYAGKDTDIIIIPFMDAGMYLLYAQNKKGQAVSGKTIRTH